MKRRYLYGLILIFCCILACAPGRVSERAKRGASVSPPVAMSFVLEIDENRTDRKKSPVRGESPMVASKSVQTLFGHAEASVSDQGTMVTFFADSIVHTSQKPFLFRTFMSADTMYYSAAGGTSKIDGPGQAVFDSMLSCVFGGPAVRISRPVSGEPDSTIHFNEACQSGEYERINAPVTLGAFFSADPARDGHPNRWRSWSPVPSFSGVGFHPQLESLYRVVKTEDDCLTAAIAADSTIENYRTLMRNGEEILIVHARFRVGGTLVIDRATALPRSGELRIRESITLLRPNAGSQVIEKTGEYRLRFSLVPRR